MSTFKGFVNELNGISIDLFTKKNWESDVFFLSHCHTDHMKGLDYNFIHMLETNPTKCVYMSKVSSVIIKHKLSGDFVKPLSINGKCNCNNILY